MRALPSALLAFAIVLAAPRASAQERGVVFGASLGGGAELALGDEEGKAGTAEVEITAGWDWTSINLRPEVAFAIGLEPDTHAAFRAGFRYLVSDSPLQLRAALDWSSARNTDLELRWLLLGVAAEARITGAFGLFAEFDSGVPLRDLAGVPLLFRGGATLRF